MTPVIDPHVRFTSTSHRLIDPPEVRHAHVRSQLAAPNTGCPRELTPHTRTRLPYTPPLAPPNRYSGRAPALSHVPARARHGRPRRLPHLRPMV
jgi:hypothetical protein